MLMRLMCGLPSSKLSEGLSTCFVGMAPKYRISVPLLANAAAFCACAAGSGGTHSTNASSIDFGVSITRIMATPAAGIVYRYMACEGPVGPFLQR